MIPGFALRQLRAAVKILACGLGSLQKRLDLSYQELEPLIAADFPSGLRKAYQDVISQLSRAESASQMMAAISDTEASQVAALVVELHFQVEAAERAKIATPSSGEEAVQADSSLVVV